MSSPLIQSLRSVALNVPGLARAEKFYTEVWHLDVVDRTPGAIWLRGTAADHHPLSLHADDEVAIRHVTLRARDEAALAAIADAVADGGGAVRVPLGALDEPAGGIGLTLRDPHGRVFQVVHGDRATTMRTRPPTARRASRARCSTATTCLRRSASWSAPLASRWRTARASWPS